MTAETDRRAVRAGLAEPPTVRDILAGAREGDRSMTFTRNVPVDDIRVRSGDGGRTVDAYAAVFLQPTEIVDQDGHYNEQNASDAFSKSVAERSGHVFCVYNHARTLSGSPSDTYSVPLGKVLAIRADKHGLLTSVRYNKDPESDRILEAIKSGSLSGMSYTGVFLRSEPQLQGPFDVYKPSRSGDLTLVTRLETALLEFGPTPIPAYETAEVIGVRSRESIRVVGTPHPPQTSAGPALYEHNTGESAQCPNCGLFNWPDASYCDQCGQMLANPEPYNSNPDDILTCSSCDQRNEPSALFCDQCGRALTSHDYADQPAKVEDAIAENKAAAKAAASSSGRQPEMDEHDRAAAPRPVDPDGDGDDDSTPEGDTDHDFWDKDGNQIQDLPGRPMPKKKGKRSDDDDAEAEHDRSDNADADTEHDRAGAIDETPWDAQKVWSAGAASKTPASFYSGTCAGRRSGDPSKQSTWALPYRYTPSGAPNAAGVAAALGRIDSTEGLINKAAAQKKLESLSAHIKASHATSDTSSTSSSGRQPDADDATSRTTEAGEATEAPTGSTAEPPTHPAPSPEKTGSRTKMEDRMTVQERVQRQADVRRRLSEIDTEYMGAELPAATRDEWTALQTELIVHGRAIEDASQRAEYMRSIMGEDGNPIEGAGETIADGRAGYGARTGSYSPASTMTRGSSAFGSGAQVMIKPSESDIYDLARIRNRAHTFDEIPLLYREYAYRALDGARFANTKGRERAQENVKKLLDTVDDDQGTLARRILTTGSPLYERAFGKALQALSTNGLTSEESRALVLGTDAAGGYAVPYQLDPTVILTYNGVINPLRSIARVEQITGKEWDGVTSTGIVVSRAAEDTEASDNSPTLVAPTVRTTRVQGFVPFSVELDMSWGAMRSQLTQMLADAKDIEEATSFTLGSGTAPQCNGVVTTLGTASYVTTAATSTVAIADLYQIEDQAAPKFRQTSSWLGSKTAYNKLRQLFTQQASAAGDPWVRPSSGTPAEFLGYPAYEASVMSSAFTSGQFILLFGDFSHFLIVDRVGMGIELIPHLFGSANRYPTGQRGIYSLWFNNSAVLASNAFRLLEVL